MPIRRKHGFKAFLSHSSINRRLLKCVIILLQIALILVPVTQFGIGGRCVEDSRRHLNNIPNISIVLFEGCQAYLIFGVLLPFDAVLFFHLDVLLYVFEHVSQLWFQLHLSLLLLFDCFEFFFFANVWPIQKRSTVVIPNFVEFSRAFESNTCICLLILQVFFEHNVKCFIVDLVLLSYPNVSMWNTIRIPYIWQWDFILLLLKFYRNLFFDRLLPICVKICHRLVNICCSPNSFSCLIPYQHN